MRIVPLGLTTAATAAAAAAVAVVGAVPGAIAGTAATPAATRPAGVTHASYRSTARIVIRPVTAAGHTASGFRARRQRGMSVSCTPAEPSPGAVSRNIEECSPSAAYAIACWKSVTPHRTLCLRDPRRKAVDSLRLSGRFAPTRVARRRDRAPLLMVLTDGTRCFIRDGGAWGTLKSRPHWYGSYSCSRHGVVWAPPRASHYGVDESHPSWTVRTAPFNGRRLVTRHIRRAYFVGTAKG